MEQFTEQEKQIGRNFNNDQIMLFNMLVNSGSSERDAFNATLMNPIGEQEDKQKGGGVLGFLQEPFRGLGEGLGNVIAGGYVQKKSSEVQEQQEQQAQRILNEARIASREGNTQKARQLLSTLQGLDFGSGVQQEFAENLPENREVIGSALQTASIVGSLGIGGATGSLSRRAGITALQGAGEGALFGLGMGIADTEATTADVARDTLTGAALGAAVGGGIPLAGALAGSTARGARQATTSLSENISKARASVAERTSGLRQIASETQSKIQRRIEDAVDSVEKAKIRAERIKNSSPAVGRAIELQVDDVILDNIVQADKSTLQLVKKGLDVSEDTARGTKNILQPIGEEAESAYRLIENERKSIGKKIEEQIGKLSPKRSMQAKTVYKKIDDVLGEIGITVTKDRDLVFTTAQFSEAERNAITKLYREVTRVGDNISPKDIYQIDSLVSKLGRESRVIDGLSDIIVEVGGERKNIYQLFREVFSNQLDEIAPAVRGLNKDYRKYRVLQDDLESTLFRDTQLLESIKGDVSKASFVPNAIRRAFSDAQTAPNYAEMLRKLQSEARTLGYKGGDIEQAGNILLRLQRDYFPSSQQVAGLRSQTGVPNIPTSTTGVAGNVINKVLNIGRNTLEDYQKAIRELIEESLN